MGSRILFLTEVDRHATPDFFDTPDPVSDPISMKLQNEDLRIAAKVSVALNLFVAEKKLDGFAYYYDGPADSELQKVLSNLIVGNSILTSKLLLDLK